MGTKIIVAVLLLGLPALIIYLSHRLQWVKQLGVVVCCYVFGLFVGLSGLLSDEVRAVPRVLSEFSILVALPLLLFSLNLRQWTRVAGKALLSMVLAVLSVTCLATLLYLVYREDAGEAANLAAMSVGVYSGGTPNLAAIKAGLDIPSDQYLAFHSLDALLGSLYFLFMLTVGIPVFRRLLPALGEPYENGIEPGAIPVLGKEDDFRPLLQWPNALSAAVVVLLALLVVAVSLALTRGWALWSGDDFNSAVLIISLTTLGILCSLLPRVRDVDSSYPMGMYLVYVFCLSISALVDIDDLLPLDTTVAVFLMVVVFAGLVLHASLCRLFGVDSDTFMVTSVAAVGSPPFVPLMARALNNPAVILPGMTTGVIGYALGSYLGIGLGVYLRSL